ncbi:MAG TPA: LysE family transporter [Solirubrobacterales bacterium]|nr:LysE family transporter [Solirubrobacterales bacterium]
MNALINGFGVALIVSLPPGPNTALLVDSAEEGMARTLPVVAGAAMTDGIYAVLASLGVLAVHDINATLIHWISAVSCLAAAIFLSIPRNRAVSGRTAIGLAFLNPSTAALWIGLSALTIAHPQGANIAFWTSGVISGTATWFLALAYVATHTPGRTTRTQRMAVRHAFAVALAIAGILAVV